MMAKNPPWERDELILALDLYRRIGIGDDKDPEVRDLSQDLGRLALDLDRPDPARFRNPNGVAMKLANFAAIDPSNGGAGLSRGGRRDAEVWSEFDGDAARLDVAVRAIRSRLESLPDGPVQRRERRYWAFAATPAIYDVEKAVENLATDRWTTKGRDVRPGDRVVIWKSKGRDAYRGAVALAEVIGEPKIGSDTENPYWVDALDGEKTERRVDVRYVHPPGLPLWLGSDPDGVLARLSVSRATGGTVFNVTEDQWDALLAAVGGWPEEVPEIATAKAVIADLAGRPSQGQGFQADSDERRTLEQYAVAIATAHYEAQGWTVQDLSARQSYDLCCRRDGAPDLHVEVKGTTSDGSSVLLTFNEVEHARARFPYVALFVVAQIKVERDSDEGIIASGGTVHRYEPWRVDDGTLKAIGFIHWPTSRDLK